MSTRKRFWLSAVMVLLALYETADSLIYYLAMDDALQTPAPGIGGRVIQIYIVAHPFLALAALLCALTGRVRWAIIALAGVVLVRWLWFLPGPNGSLDSKELYALQPTIKLLIIPPLLAAGALALAWRNERLGLATLLVSIPLIWNAWEIVMFAAAVTIYGGA